MANRSMNISFEKAKFDVTEDGEIIIIEELKDRDVETDFTDVLKMFKGVSNISISIKHKEELQD